MRPVFGCLLGIIILIAILNIVYWPLRLFIPAGLAFLLSWVVVIWIFFGGRSRDRW